jgi:uncharacterized protein YfaS (alpha-2-macroglobulin family)
MLPGTPNFTTAVVIYALSQLDPASQSLSPALQYMLTHRKADQLGSSNFETTWMLMAITAAMRGTGDYQADFNYQAYLNEDLILEGSPSGPAPLTAVKTSKGIEALYPDSPNALLIERGAGEGILYYRVDLQTFQHASEAEAINQGISLHREYILTDEGCMDGETCEPINGVTLDPEGMPPIITVTLTMIVPHDMVNLMVEDFIPAGTEIVNRKFLTTQILPEVPLPLYDPRNPFSNGWGWWYFDTPQIYDDRILWTVDYLPAGTYILNYELLPFQRGEFQVLPAHAWQYFYPEVQGTTAGELFIID